MRDQRGQALAIVLVVMAVLFALAGAITIGSSALLRQQGGLRNAFTDDLAAQSAAADAVAQVAGNQPPKCGVSTASFPRTNQPPTPLSITFPNVSTDVESVAYCSRLDHVSAQLPGSFYLNPTWNDGNSCTNLSVPTSNQRSWIFFNARWTGSGGYAFVDGNSTIGSCTTPPPTPKPGPDPCSSKPPQPSCVRCGQVVSSSTTPRVAQVVLDCDMSATGSLYLHVYNPAHSPARAFTVTQDPTGGVIYLLAANNKVGSASAYEETVLLVGPGGNPNHLLYEAPLP